MTTITPIIDATGISAPPLPDIVSYLQAQYRSIYGADVYLGADSQDGQFLAIIAAAINDCNAATVAVFNSFSPATAQGAGLSSVVKLNGIRRQESSFSTADVTIGGTAGTIIANGIVQDAAGNKWNLPSSVTIPPGGSIVATATCQTAGAIIAPANTITLIVTPTRGWQTVSNAAAAAIGAPVESDPILRQRQQISTEQPSLTVLGGIEGAVANVPGVSRYRVYENDSATTDGNGVPRNSISFVVDGGDATAIATAIASKKPPGTGTFGSTSVVVTDAASVPNTINFYRPIIKTIQVALTIKALAGYLSTTGALIQADIAAYLNALGIGAEVYLQRLYPPANLNQNTLAATYNITALTIGANGGTKAATDIAVAFNEAASCVVSDVVITVT